ncbi:MAG: TrbG/VirB9 family P-type conjugative transfer protein [Desulfovibrio sp.]|jgi:type IV secretion system protein VirB9|nr:TrbG/VirB9 family P-type conjugative transfer protein [Desulfovibrio sp.]
MVICQYKWIFLLILSLTITACGAPRPASINRSGLKPINDLKYYPKLAERQKISIPAPARREQDEMPIPKMQEQRDVMPPAGIPSGAFQGNLDYGYTVAGSAPWKPVRVFSNGEKTIIQLPGEMQSEVPTLLIVRPAGPIRYQVQGDRYIVDGLFDQAVLVTGVGSAQNKVTITRK